MEIQSQAARGWIAGKPLAVVDAGLITAQTPTDQATVLPAPIVQAPPHSSGN